MVEKKIPLVMVMVVDLVVILMIMIEYEHCGHNRHTKDACWDLLGHPLDSQAQTRTFPRGRGGGQFGSNQSNAYSMTTTPSYESPTTISTTPIAYDGILSCEEVRAFRQFVTQLNHPHATSTSSFAPSISSTSTFNAFISSPSSSWVIDSEASHYMIGMSSLFSSYHECSGRDEVHIVYGSYSSIASKVDIVASRSLHLSSIFHVPNFSLNLLLVILQNVLIVVSHCFLLIVCFRIWKRG